MSTPTSSGLLFGPNASGKQYLSVHYHRDSGRRSEKNQWDDAVPPAMEHAIFCDADSGNWQGGDGHYWGVHDKGERVLGTRGQRICKFPRTSNHSDPWHGYPVSPSEEDSRDAAPPDDLIEDWIASDVIEKKWGRRIQRRKI